MASLINKADFTDIIYLTGNLDFDKKIKPHVLSSQELQLAEWIGADFALDVVANPANYAELLNGKAPYPGIKKILVYLSMSKAIWDLNLEASNDGYVFKNNEYSSGASEKILNRKSTEYYNTAVAYWKKAEIYLNSNREMYPLWRRDECCDRQDISTRPRISGVGASQDIYNYEIYPKYGR
jgi:hypothetical protein